MRISDWSSDVCSSDLPAAINIAGPATGMEYPGIVFDGIDDAGKELFWISAHEIGHSWFPMIVGFDERRSAEHTSELQSLMRISYAVFCLKKKTRNLIIAHLSRPYVNTMEVI